MPDDPADPASEPASPESGPAEPRPSLDAGQSESGAVEAYVQRLRLAEDRLAEVLGGYRQLRTETEAHRERVTRTLEQQYSRRREKLLVKFIDILDSFDRALEAAEQTGADDAMIQGLILVRTQLLGVLKDEGLERVPAVGLAFDPHVAEAVSMTEVKDADHHQVVVKELLRGYRLNDRMVRPARVVVGEFRGAAPAAPAPDPALDPAEAPPLELDETPTDGSS